MELPQEIEVWYIIPALRRKFALAMKKKGLKQKDIARLLGLTEPAVSQYIKNKRAGSVVFTEKIEERIEKAVENMISKKTCQNYEIQQLLLLIKEEGLLCDVHREHCNLPKNCELCVKPGV